MAGTGSGGKNAGIDGGIGKQLVLAGLATAVRIYQYLDDLAAVFLTAVGLVTGLGLLRVTQGGLIDPWVLLLERWTGWGAILIPLSCLVAAALLLRRGLGHSLHISWLRVVSLEITFFAGLGILSLLTGSSLPLAEQGGAGGLIGWGIGVLLADVLGSVGASLTLVGLLAISGWYGIRGLAGRLRGLWATLEQPSRARAPRRALASTPPAQPKPAVEPQASQAVRRRRSRRLPSEFRKNFEVPEQADERPEQPMMRDERLPPFDLLEDGESRRVSSRDINQAAGHIEKTLADFGLPVSVVDFRVGPSVTQFAVKPGFVEQVSPDGEIRRSKVRVSQITALANDLALALSAPRVRIQAPVPGQSYVGIEVPNRHAAIVRLQPVLESEAYLKIASPLTIALGRDVAGSSVAADLASMPHLLIAGTTGSGKSVCISSITLCLVMSNTPDDLRLVMIDPKRVELIRFNGLPHLFGNVEVDLDRITGVLRWCTMEMDRRYRLLEEARARNIETYNQRMRRRRNVERLPRIVVLVDELADLMMMAPDQTERTLVRLAQMGRATGIHLVLATQRPSTDILTGLIKANFPARISFAVASGVDSRVILDTQGAETLLGRGDMLYLAPEAALPNRLQGVFVSDVEIERVMRFWREQTEEAAYELGEEPPWESVLARQEALDERDELLEEAIELVRQEGEASASMLQRRLRVGYPRAARLMDELEELGVIGEAQAGGQTREVLIGDEDPLMPEEDR